MGWLDVIKAIRRNDEEEKRLNQQGGAINRTFGFLDNTFDAVENVGKKAVGTAAGFARESVLKPIITTGKSLRQSQVGTTRDNFNKSIDELKKTSYEDRKKRMAEDETFRLNLEMRGITDPTDKALDESKKKADKKVEKSKEATTPETRAEKMVLGNDPIQSYQERYQGLKKDSDKGGAGWGGALAALGTGVNVALDSPLSLGIDDAVKSIGKSGMKALAKEGTEDGVKTLLQSKLPQELIDKAAPLIAKATDTKEVASILRSVSPRKVKAALPDPTKAVDAVTSLRNKLTGAAPVANAVADNLQPKTAEDFVSAITPPTTKPVIASVTNKKDPLIQEYADSLAQMESGLAGGNKYKVNSNGTPVMSEHTKFYRDHFAANGSAPNKDQWYAEAEKQVKSGKADKYFMDYYNEMNNPEFKSLAASADSAMGRSTIGDTLPISPSSGSSVDGFVQSAMPKSMDVLPQGKQRQRAFLDTVQNSDTSLPELQQGVKDITPQTYTQKANPLLLQAAEKRVAEDYDGALRAVKNTGPADDETVAMGNLLIGRMQNEKRFDDAIELTELLDKRLRENGRGSQAASLWGRLTPEGALRFAVKQVEKARDLAKKGGLLKGAKDDVKVANEIKSTIQNSGAVTRDSVQRIINEVAEGQASLNLGDKVEEGLSTAQQIAKKVDAAASPPKVKKQADLLVQEIVKKVKQEMLTPQPAKKPRAAIDILKETLGRSDEANAAFPLAQDILRAKYANAPKMTEALDTFFGAKLGLPAADSTINRSIQDQLRERGERVSDIIVKSWAEQKQSVEDIASALTKEGFDSNSATALAKEISGKLNAQVLEARKAALEKLSKEVPKPQMPSILDKINKLSNLGALEEKDYLEMARTKLKLPQLQESTAKTVSELSQKIQGLPDGDEKDKLIADMMRAITSDIPTTFADKIAAYRYQNMLSGPRTQARNSIGNLIQAGVTMPLTKLYRGGVDFVESSLTGKQREYYVKEVPEYYKGLFKGFDEAIDQFRKGWAGDIQQPDLQNINAYASEKMPKALTVIGRAMEAQDRFFQSLVKSGEYAVQKSKGATDEIAEEAAGKLSKYAVFRQATDAKNATGQGDVLSKIDQVTDSITKFGKDHKAFRWFVPFVQTPANITKQMIEYSPVGITTLKGASSTAKRDQLAKTALGTTMTGIGAMYAFQGKTTWAPPTDKAEKEAFYSSGKKPYSIKIGDTWMPMISFGPLGYSLGLPAAIKDANDKGDVDDGAFEKIADVIAGQAQFFTQQTYLQGVSNFVNAMTGQGNTGDMGKDLASAGAGVAGQLIPLQALSRYVNSAIDPVVRKKKGAVDTLVSDIPIVGAQYSKNNMEANTNVFTGEEMKRNASDYVAPYSMGKDAANPDDAKFQEGVTEFYKTRGRVSSKKTQAEEYIDKALASGDTTEARNAALDYNDWLAEQFDPWNEKYGQYASDDLQETYDRMKISTSGLSRRKKNIREREKDSTINYK